MTRTSARSPTFTRRAAPSSELAELLSRNGNVDRGRHADRLARLADAHRLPAGRRARRDRMVRAGPRRRPGPRGRAAGLPALLDGRALAPVRRGCWPPPPPRTDSWQLLLDLVPLRLAGASDPGDARRILEDAAACAETRAGDQKRALAWLCEALPLAGANAKLERELLRLAEATGDFAGAARRWARPSPPAARRR